VWKHGNCICPAGVSHCRNGQSKATSLKGDNQTMNKAQLSESFISDFTSTESLLFGDSLPAIIARKNLIIAQRNMGFALRTYSSEVSFYGTSLQITIPPLRNNGRKHSTYVCIIAELISCMDLLGSQKAGSLVFSMKLESASSRPLNRFRIEPVSPSSTATSLLPRVACPTASSLTPSELKSA
jgi:hypothetical protein